PLARRVGFEEKVAVRRSDFGGAEAPGVEVPSPASRMSFNAAGAPPPQPRQKRAGPGGALQKNLLTKTESQSHYKGDLEMRFMMIVKHAENQGPPPKELMDAIAKLAEDDAKTGTMLGSGGLKPTTQGAAVRLSKGRVTVIDGPFTEAKEIIGGEPTLCV